MIQECAAKSNLKKVALELGGKSPNIIFADADRKYCKHLRPCSSRCFIWLNYTFFEMLTYANHINNIKTLLNRSNYDLDAYTTGSYFVCIAIILLVVFRSKLIILMAHLAQFKYNSCSKMK